MCCSRMDLLRVRRRSIKPLRPRFWRGRSRSRSIRMKVVASIVCAAIVTLATVTLSAHLITSKGKVTAVEKEAVKVDVVDPETKKVIPRTFIVDEQTKVLRDDKLVKFADAR